MVITSINNEQIKNLRKLKNIKEVKENKMFLVESPNLINEAYKTGNLIKLITTKKSNYEVEEIFVSDNVIKSLSDMKNPPSMIGVCKFDLNHKTLSNKILILDDIQDPGNLGTMIRSAKAFNFDTIVLSENTVCKYNSKVIRASEGMFFKMNIIEKDIKDFIIKIKEDGYKVYTTSVTKASEISSISFPLKFAVVIGNEGKGVSSQIASLCDNNIYINMNNDCESLNASVAASIIMYEASKKVN